MANKFRGEISAQLDDKSWTLCLTLGALANLEDALGIDNLASLSEKISTGKLSANDLLKIIHAGLLGGGYQLSYEDVSSMKVDNGLNGYVEIVARLLEATFMPLRSHDQQK